MKSRSQQFKRFRVLLAITVGVILAFSIMGSKVSANQSNSAGFKMVHIVNYRFVPSTVTINPGDAVTFTNDDNVDSDFHDVSIYTGNCCVDSFSIITGQVFTRRYCTPGQYIVVLRENPQVIGRIIVRSPAR